MKQTNKNSKVG